MVWRRQQAFTANAVVRPLLAGLRARLMCGFRNSCLVTLSLARVQCKVQSTRTALPWTVHGF